MYSLLDTVTRQLYVKESPRAQDHRETLPWGFDTSALLLPAEVPTNASAELTDLADDSDYSMTGLGSGPTITGNIIIQTVTSLRKGHRYLLAVSFDAAVGKRWTMLLELRCPR